MAMIKTMFHWIHNGMAMVSVLFLASLVDVNQVSWLSFAILVMAIGLIVTAAKPYFIP